MLLTKSMNVGTRTESEKKSIKRGGDVSSAPAFKKCSKKDTREKIRQ